MLPLLRSILLIAWSLWFGGMVALLIFVTRLFSASRPVAVEAAPILFRTFATYQTTIGLVVCAAGTLLTLLTRRKLHASMTLLMLAALAAALLIRGWTFEMDRIRLAGQSGGPEFKALHARSSLAYTASAALLLVGGIGMMTGGTAPAPRTTPQ